MPGPVDGGVQTVHHGHMPEIEITLADHGPGHLGHGGPPALGVRARCATCMGIGHYHETYEKGAQGWRIASTSLTRLRVDVAMNQMIWPAAARST